jgi:hypothetical protein
MMERCLSRAGYTFGLPSKEKLVKVMGMTRIGIRNE